MLYDIICLGGDSMLDIALKLLKEFTDHSYKAYIVGGFVRDYVLGIESSDIDITTNATPKEIKEIFVDSCLPNDDYGSVTVIISKTQGGKTTLAIEMGMAIIEPGATSNSFIFYLSFYLRKRLIS